MNENINNGWISLHRKLLNKAFMAKPKYLAVWIYLLLNANYDNKEFIFNNKTIMVKQGQLITSQLGISKFFNISIGTVSRILNYFKTENQIEIEATNQFSLISIINYHQYQLIGNPNGKRIENGLKTNGKRIETNNKDNKDNKDNKEIILNNYMSIFDEFRKMFPGTKRGNETEFENFKKKHFDWQEILPLLKTKLEGQISAREQKKANNEFIPVWKNLQTWINQRCWEEEIKLTGVQNGTNTGKLSSEQLQESQRRFNQYYGITES